MTDVTGFGLAGHGWEMAERSGVDVVFDGAALPLYPSVRSLAASGVKTGGHDRNQTYLGSHLVVTADPLFEARSRPRSPDVRGLAGVGRSRRRRGVDRCRLVAGRGGPFRIGCGVPGVSSFLV